MHNDESNYIKYCKSLIEEKLGWSSSNAWKQRDFLNLIELLENKTGILLSLSTIKRIWKTDYDGTPHPSTLEAFALFLDYNSWLDFKEKNQPNIPAKNNGRPINDKFKWIHGYKKTSVSFIIIILLSGIFFAIYQFSMIKEGPKNPVFNPEEVAFSCNNSVSKGVPNTVIFKYDISRVKADSFFIQQSWNKLHKERIQKSDYNLTSVYYYPGYHMAKLIANDSVIQTINVRINTDNWLALARHDYMEEIPLYIQNKDIIKDGELYVTTNHLKKNNIDINKNLFVSYYYVEDFKNISSGNFGFETRLKCDSLFNIPCPQITICILGEKHINIIPLAIKGCIGNTMVKIGNVVKYGKNNDLSAFGVDVYKWQDFTLSVINNKAAIFINRSRVYEMEFTEDIGNIIGFNLNFTGTGSVDYVKLLDKNNKAVYSTDFD